MTPLSFRDRGAERLAAVAGRRLLCAFDFDGTLAPIVSNPDDAQLAPAIRQRLLTLAMHAPLAIITGRSIADVKSRLGFEPDYLIGNHGLEGVPGTSDSSERYRHLCAAWLRTLKAACDQSPHLAQGIQLENKGCSLALHYRHAHDAVAAEGWVRAVIRKMTPAPHVIGGKYVLNLLPAGAGDKGAALLQLLHASGAAAAVYAGDDVTDEDVFRLRHSDVIGISIGREQETHAEYFVPQQDDIAMLLDQLIDNLKRCDAENWLRQDSLAIP